MDYNLTVERTGICNLLRSREGSELPAELCLRVLEEVVDADPKSVGVLMCLSKGICFLLKEYEHSIVKRLAVNGNILYPVCPSLASPEYVSFEPLSYPWLSEIRSRTAIIEFLIRHEVSDMTRFGMEETTGSQARSANGPLSQLALRTEKIKREALLLMYQMVDSTAGLKRKHSIRTRQIEFLETLSPMELATLGCFVKALGLGYSEHMKLQPKPMIEGHIRERMCVFEDKVLRYGPFFAWATVAGTQRSRRWARIAMLEGLNDMEAFERGQSMAYASLQSVVWNVFCKKAECDLADSWNIIQDIVEEQLVSHKA